MFIESLLSSGERYVLNDHEVDAFEEIINVPLVSIFNATVTEKIDERAGVTPEGACMAVCDAAHVTAVAPPRVSSRNLARRGGKVATRVAHALHEHGERVVIMGDLNEEHRPAWFIRLLEVYQDADSQQERLTFPSDKPRIRIDYLLANQGSWEDVLVTEEREASDHLPLSGLLVL